MYIPNVADISLDIAKVKLLRSRVQLATARVWLLNSVLVAVSLFMHLIATGVRP